MAFMSKRLYVMRMGKEDRIVILYEKLQTGNRFAKSGSYLGKVLST